MTPLRRTDLMELRRTIQDHYMAGGTAACAVIYDPDGMELVPAYGAGATRVMHANARALVVDCVSAGQFVERPARRGPERIPRPLGRADMVTRLFNKIEWIADNIGGHRGFLSRSAWADLDATFSGLVVDGSLVAELHRACSGGRSGRHAICLDTYENSIGVCGVLPADTGARRPGGHPGLVDELVRRGSAVLVSAAYSAGDMDRYGPDRILDNVRKRLTSLYDFPTCVTRGPVGLGSV